MHVFEWSFSGSGEAVIGTLLGLTLLLVALLPLF